MAFSSDIEIKDENIQVTNPEAQSTETIVPAQVQQPEIKNDVVAPEAEIKKDTPTFDVNEYVKKTFGYDNEDVAKTEIENLKKLKDNPPKREFSIPGNEDAIYEHLKAKRELSNLDKLSAKDIVKLNTQYQNKDLSPDEVEFLVNEKYSIPEKPEQEYDELAENYANRIAKWEKAVNTAETKIGIDSKVAKRELSKLNSELVLPDIKNADAEKQEAAQKELQASIRKGYEQALESDFKNFNGFSVTYKDKDVEIPISYTIPDEEKITTKNDLKEMDVDDFLGSRWFDKEGKPNIQQQMSDKYVLANISKILQKVAQDTGAKVLEHYVRSQKNITIGQPVALGNGSIDNRTELQKIQEARWKKTG